MGFTTASCSAYITMNGVMIPGVSAGSNQVGASEICMHAPDELTLRTGGAAHTGCRGGGQPRSREGERFAAGNADRIRHRPTFPVEIARPAHILLRAAR